VVIAMSLISSELCAFAIEFKIYDLCDNFQMRMLYFRNREKDTERYIGKGVSMILEYFDSLLSVTGLS